MTFRKLMVSLAVLGMFSGSAYAGTGDSKAGEKGSQEAAEKFTQMDRNGDGVLSRDEVQGDSRLSNKLSEIDQNGDGQISLSEYLASKSDKGGSASADRMGGETGRM